MYPRVYAGVIQYHTIIQETVHKICQFCIKLYKITISVSSINAIIICILWSEAVHDHNSNYQLRPAATSRQSKQARFSFGT